MTQSLRVLFSFFVGAIVSAGAILTSPAPAANAPLPWREARLFAEVFQRVRDSYVDEVPEQRLAQAAARGMARALDPYSAYLNAAEVADLRRATAGEYAGVGVEISLDQGEIEVLAVIEDSPAARAGMRAGDVIVAVDGAPVDPDQLNAFVERMRGAAGARIKLEAMREGHEQALTFDLTRGEVQVHSVRHELLAPGYAYVRIRQFTDSTAAEFSAALDDLQKNAPPGLRGLALDLRDNPGGVLEAAAEVADALLDKGMIVTARGRSEDARFAAQATPGDAMRGAPIVALVNQGSASAAEILAAALKDNKRATLMGHRTYGKGSVQTVLPLSDGGALKLTTALYYTPSGVSINRRGIAPDMALSSAGAPPAEPQMPAWLRDDGEARAALAKLQSLARR